MKNWRTLNDTWHPNCSTSNILGRGGGGMSYPVTMYEINLGQGRKAFLELPKPFREMSPEEKTEIREKVFKVLDAVVEANRFKALSDYHAFISDAKKLKKEWKFTKEELALKGTD